jgi:hypothetical protein
VEERKADAPRRALRKGDVALALGLTACPFGFKCSPQEQLFL